MSGRYLGVVSCMLPMIREMGDEWKVSRCSQLCVTDDQGVFCCFYYLKFFLGF